MQIVDNTSNKVFIPNIYLMYYEIRGKQLFLIICNNIVFQLINNLIFLLLTKNTR